MKKGWIVIWFCIGLGILTETTIFQNNIGISYCVFIAAFYGVFFFINRQGPFNHKQINGLLFIAILILTISFVVFSNPYFYAINYLLLPVLLVFHTVLLTSSKEIKWHTSVFRDLLIKKLDQFVHSIKISSKYSRRRLKKRVNEETYQTGKKVMVGVLLSVPLLFVIMTLLSSADEKFAKVLTLIPEVFTNIPSDIIWRVLIIAILSIVFHSYFKVVGKRTKLNPTFTKQKHGKWDTIIVSTILVFINLVYAIFIAVQFNYFFSGTLQSGLSYAEYARRGFFELLAVTLINYIILISTISFMKKERVKIVHSLLTMLILFSCVLLVSAFARLMLYEQAYGFTFLRVLAHAAMIYLFVIFAFTLIKVWARRLSLSRFYLLFTLLFYVGLNVFGVDQFIVEKNMERFEDTGKIDVEYLGSLSYTAIPPLVNLYEKNPNIVGLEELLISKHETLYQQDFTSWQSYNISRKKAGEALDRLELHR